MGGGYAEIRNILFTLSYAHIDYTLILTFIYDFTEEDVTHFPNKAWYLFI